MHYQAFYKQILREASTTNKVKENAKPSEGKETAKSSRRSARLLTRKDFGAWTAVIDCRQRRPRPARGAWDRCHSVTKPSAVPARRLATRASQVSLGSGREGRHRTKDAKSAALSTAALAIRLEALPHAQAKTTKSLDAKRRRANKKPLTARIR